MVTREIPCAASSLLAGLVDGPEVRLAEVARTRVSVHYETGDPAVPVLCVCTPTAVRLPNSLVTDVLPDPESDGPGLPNGRRPTPNGADLNEGLSTGSVIGRGGFRAGGTTWRVRRWWQPPRPSWLPRPTLADLAAVSPQLGLPGVPVPCPSYDGLSPSALVGSGPGLTPAGDDVLAGALVTAHATHDPRLSRWRATTREALTATRTTAVSRAMLHHALDGYATPELAGFLTALCLGHDITRTRTDLLAVGHTSGSALLAGVVYTLSTRNLEGAA